MKNYKKNRKNAHIIEPVSTPYFAGHMLGLLDIMYVQIPNKSNTIQLCFS